LISKGLLFFYTPCIENPFDLREKTDLAELNKTKFAYLTKTMASQQFNKASKVKKNK
jgi:hypothetical protein